MKSLAIKKKYIKEKNLFLLTLTTSKNKFLIHPAKLETLNLRKNIIAYDINIRK